MTRQCAAGGAQQKLKEIFGESAPRAFAAGAVYHFLIADAENDVEKSEAVFALVLGLFETIQEENPAAGSRAVWWSQFYRDYFEHHGTATSFLVVHESLAAKLVASTHTTTDLKVYLLGIYSWTLKGFQPSLDTVLKAMEGGASDHQNSGGDRSAQIEVIAYQLKSFMTSTDFSEAELEVVLDVAYAKWGHDGTQGFLSRVAGKMTTGVPQPILDSILRKTARTVLSKEATFGVREVGMPLLSNLLGVYCAMGNRQYSAGIYEYVRSALSPESLGQIVDRQQALKELERFSPTDLSMRISFYFLPYVLLEQSLRDRIVVLEELVAYATEKKIAPFTNIVPNLIQHFNKAPYPTVSEVPVESHYFLLSAVCAPYEASQFEALLPRREFFLPDSQIRNLSMLLCDYIRIAGVTKLPQGLEARIRSWGLPKIDEASIGEVEAVNLKRLRKEVENMLVSLKELGVLN